MKYVVCVVLLGFMGCSDPYEDCVAKKQESWRQSNPNADYAKSSTANERFRKECTSVKKS
jgi:hypothetical protein